MAEAASGGKTCVVCGTDVAGKPRVKDAKGRYSCAGECEKQLAVKAREAARPPAARSVRAPVAAPEEEDTGLGMAHLLGDSPMAGASACGGCGAVMPKGSVVCMKCGFNTASGARVNTKVSVERAPKVKRVRVKGISRYSQGEFGPSFAMLLLIFCGAAALVAALGALGPELFVVSMVVLAIFGLVSWGWAVIAAFANERPGWGVVGILSFIGPVGLVFMFYVLLINPDKFSKAMYIANFVGWIAVVLVVAAAYGGHMPPIYGKTL